MKSLTNCKNWYKFDQNRSRNDKVMLFEGFNMANSDTAILNI